MTTKETPLVEEVLGMIPWQVPMTRQRLLDMWVNFFETANSSWFHEILDVDYGSHRVEDFWKGGKFHLEPYTARQMMLVTPGCAIEFLVDDPVGPTDTKIVAVTLFGTMVGLQAMAQNNPREFKNILEENDDADTADTFAQFAVYGQEIYC